MMVQTRKKKVPHAQKEIIRKIITFLFAKLLLLRSPKNKRASNIVITEKKKNKSDIPYMPELF